MPVVSLRGRKAPLPEGVVRIDRKTKWGNPHPMKNESAQERSRVIEAYRESLWADILAGRVTLRDLASLHGKTVACWCFPLPCHGDVLLKAAAWAAAEIEMGRESWTGPDHERPEWAVCRKSEVAQ